MGEAVRAVHRHGKAEDAVVCRFDDHVRRNGVAVAVGDGHRRFDCLVGLWIAVWIVEDAIEFDSDRGRAGDRKSVV